MARRFVESEKIDIGFDGKRCIHSRNCVLGNPYVFVPNAPGEWIHPEAGSVEAVVLIAHSCPSGAITYHRILLDQPYDKVVRSVGRVMTGKAPVAFGLALVENAYDETACVEAMRPAEFEKREEALLALARQVFSQQLRTSHAAQPDQAGG